MAVIASGDGSSWGSNSGCENQGSCARQGATMDTGDSGCDPRLVRGVCAAGANRAQWLERLSYCGSEQAAGTALLELRR